MNAEDTQDTQDTQPKYRGIPERAKPLTRRQMMSQMAFRRGPQPADVKALIARAKEAERRKAADSKSYVRQAPDEGE